MKKILITAMVLFILIALAACGSNDDTQETPPVTTTQNEYNQTGTVEIETPTEDLPSEELIIQIDTATDELISTFANLHRVNVGEPSANGGISLVMWANRPLPHLAMMVLEAEWLEDRDEWGFIPRDNFGYVEMLLPGEGYLIMNYLGLGTLPHTAISFFDEDIRDTRVFFIQENHAYPYHGNQWIIQEIEADWLIWTGTATYGLDSTNEQGQQGQTEPSPVTEPAPPVVQPPVQDPTPPQAEQPINPLLNFTIEEYHGATPAVLELIFENEQSRYYLSSARSNLIMLVFDDGQRVSLRYAIDNEMVTIAALIANGLNLIYAPQLEPVTLPTDRVTMNVLDVSPGGISFMFVNPSDRNYIFGSHYTLYVRNNGLWERVQPIIDWDWTFTDEANPIFPNGASAVITVDWLWNLGELPSGEYQFAKEVIYIRTPGDFDRHTLIHEFTL